MRQPSNAMDITWGPALCLMKWIFKRDTWIRWSATSEDEMQENRWAARSPSIKHDPREQHFCDRRWIIGKLCAQDLPIDMHQQQLCSTLILTMTMIPLMAQVAINNSNNINNNDNNKVFSIPKTFVI